jgi:hypothetical protein
LRNSIISFFNYSEETISSSSSSGFRSCIVRESDLAIHVLGANDPSDFFHVGLAGHAFVVVVGAVADLEWHRVRLAEEGAQDDLFALRESALDVCPVARVAQRLAGLRFSVSNENTHTRLSNRRSPDFHRLKNNQPGNQRQR